MNFIYNGKEYDVGTKVRIKTVYYGEQIMTLERSSVNGLQFIGINNYSIPVRLGVSDLVIEIVEPVEVIKQPSNNRNYPSDGDIDIGWIWYIIIMAIGTIFNDRILIWGFATAVFFLWKNGFFGGKK